MKIIVTSHNPVKIAAAREAFTSRFKDSKIQLIPVDVKSGVPAQPMSDQETRQGARNRVNNAKRQYPDADFWVGMEGGLDFFDDRLMAFAWMVIAGGESRLSETRTATLPLPPRVRALSTQPSSTLS